MKLAIDLLTLTLLNKLTFVHYVSYYNNTIADNSKLPIHDENRPNNFIFDVNDPFDRQTLHLPFAANCGRNRQLHINSMKCFM
jgi:hypothetical protein